MGGGEKRGDGRGRGAWEEGRKGGAWEERSDRRGEGSVGGGEKRGDGR